MKVIIYKNDDDGLCVIYPAYQPEMSQEQQDEFLRLVQNKDVPKMPDDSIRASWIIEAEETSKLRSLRNAWKVDDNGQIFFDRNKGEELKKEQFRNLRKPLLEKLDVQFMRALEVGDTSTIQIVTQKKSELRDITSVDFSSYDTPQKLHEFIPDLLKT